MTRPTRRRTWRDWPCYTLEEIKQMPDPLPPEHLYDDIAMGKWWFWLWPWAWKREAELGWLAAEWEALYANEQTANLRRLRARLLARLRATRWACGILRKLQALEPHEWDRATLKEVRMAMIQCPKENA